MDGEHHPGLVIEQSDESLDDAGSSRQEGTKRPTHPLLREIKDGEDRESEAKVARHAIKMWKSHDPFMERALAQWKVNQARRRGVTNAKMLFRRDQDTHWTAWIPSNASPDLTPDVNKAATLCRRMTALINADPHVPVVAAAGRDFEEESQAEFTERALLDLTSESNLNDSKAHRSAFDRTHVFGSAYVWYYVDAHGGGKLPMEVRARPDAQDVQGALLDPEGNERGPYATRYVTEDGLLTDDPEQAKEEWIPALRRKVLDGRHVRLIPHTCEDVWDAHGVMIGSFRTWGELKDIAPDLANLPEDQISEMLKYRPKFSEDILDGDEDMQPTGKELRDEHKVFVLTMYYRQCEDFPEGLYLIVVGGKAVLHRSGWMDESGERPKALDLPLTQHSGFEEGESNYWKTGLMEIVGPGNELRGAQIAGWLDHLEKFNNRKWFVPTNSIVKPQQMLQGRGAWIPMNPGGQPVPEDIPSWPADSYSMIEFTGKEMDDASSLQDIGGLNSKDVESGRHAFAIISQVHAGLSEIIQNVERARRRGWRIILQLARAFYDVEQELEWVGEDGAFRMDAWKGTDLLSDVDVQVKAGSGTMLAPAAKAQLAERYASLNVMDRDELRDVLASSIGGVIGLQDNPHRMHIRRQLAKWLEGPPDGWREAPPAPAGLPPGTSGVIQMPQQGMMAPPPPAPPPPVVQEQQNPMTGQIIVQIVDPDLADIFDATPADSLPGIAQMRLTEIAKVMASEKYRRQPPEWRQGLDGEFKRMQIAATPPMQPQAPSQDGGGGKKGELPGGQKLPSGAPMTDLHEDALQEGAPPDVVLQA